MREYATELAETFAKLDKGEVLTAEQEALLFAFFEAMKALNLRFAWQPDRGNNEGT